MVDEKFLAVLKGHRQTISLRRVPSLVSPGLQPGDRWCLCAARWLHAYQEGAAAPVLLASTHERTLEIVPLEILKEFALDAAPVR